MAEKKLTVDQKLIAENKKLKEEIEKNGDSNTLWV